MIKKLLLSLLIIAGVSGSAILGTQALLTDTATLAANTVSTGSINLTISNSQSSTNPTTFSESRPGFNNVAVRPGQTKSFLFWLKNNETDVAMSLSGQATVATTTDGVAENQVIISIIPVNDDGTDIGGAPIASANLQQWKASVLSFGFPPAYELLANTRHRYRMDVKMDNGITLPGTATFDFVFTGTEVVSTP